MDTLEKQLYRMGAELIAIVLKYPEEEQKSVREAEMDSIIEAYAALIRGRL